MIFHITIFHICFFLIKSNCQIGILRMLWRATHRSMCRYNMNTIVSRNITYSVCEIVRPFRYHILRRSSSRIRYFVLFCRTILSCYRNDRCLRNCFGIIYGNHRIFIRSDCRNIWNKRRVQICHIIIYCRRECWRKFSTTKFKCCKCCIRRSCNLETYRICLTIITICRNHFHSCLVAQRLCLSNRYRSSFVNRRSRDCRNLRRSCWQNTFIH